MSMTNCPEIHWVPVVDETGRRRLEMRWQIGAPRAVTVLPSRASATTRAA